MLCYLITKFRLNSSILLPFDIGICFLYFRYIMHNTRKGKTKDAVLASKKQKTPGATSSSTATTDPSHSCLRFSSGPHKGLCQHLQQRTLDLKDA